MKEYFKTKKGKITIFIISVAVIGLGLYGIMSYQNYQDSLKSEVVFKDIDILNEVSDFMTLVDSYKADELKVLHIEDENGKVVENFETGKRYVVVFKATTKQHEMLFNKLIEFVDTTAPILNGVVENVEVEYGTEYDPLSGVSAIDDFDGNVEVLANKVLTENPQTQLIEYSSKDKAGNEIKGTTTVTVKAPACAVNASFNWETGDCVCESGYTGDGWTGCTVVKKSTSTVTGSKTNTSSGGNKTSGNSNTSQSNTSGTTGSSNGGNGWTVDDPTVGRVPDSVVNDCNQNYNGSCAGLVFGDGSYVIGQ